MKAIAKADKLILYETEDNKGYCVNTDTGLKSPEKYIVSLLSLSDEWEPFEESIEKAHQANPPFPGGVFDERKHRWVQPDKEDEKKDNTFFGRYRKVFEEREEGNYLVGKYENMLYMENDKLDITARVEFAPEDKTANIENLMGGFRKNLSYDERRKNALEVIKDIVKRVPNDYQLIAKSGYDFTSGLYEGLINEGIAERKYARDVGWYYIIDKAFVPKEVKQVTLLDKINARYDSIIDDTEHFNISGEDIYIGHGISWDKLDDRGPDIDQNMTILAGPKKWAGKRFYDISEVKDEVIKQYRDTLHFTGGDFSKAKRTDNRRIVANMIYRYKNVLGSEPKYLIAMAKAYYSNGKLDDYHGRDIIKRYEEDRKDHPDQAAKGWLTDERMYNDMLYSMNDNNYEGEKVIQEAVDQFYSEVKATQEALKKVYSSEEVLLHRGIRGKYAFSIKKATGKEDKVEAEVNEVNSWSASKDIASSFAIGSVYGRRGGKGVVLNKKFKIKDILFSHLTSADLAPEETVPFGGTAEQEFLIGNPDKKMSFTKDEVEEVG